jgi:hypothetical protein
MLARKDSLFTQFISAFPKIAKLNPIAISVKLSNLLDYETVYYIPKHRLWIVLDYDFPSSYITYAAFHHHRNLANLYLHECSMLTTDDIKELEQSVNDVEVEDHRIIISNKLDEFVNFLDNNHKWLKRVSKVNKYVSMH